jgi:hypothetical protein
MAVRLQAIFINPPIAVARLGGSNVPMDSFRWIDSPNPHLQTVIFPDWSLDVNAEGFVSPRMPESLTFRDGGLMRPVAPFFELWGLNGDDGSAPATWQQVPLTDDLLSSLGGTVSLTVDARNRKAARRARNPDLVFGTFPPITIASDNHRQVPLVAISPPGVARPMIPRASSGIPFGMVQLLQSQPQPAAGSTQWASAVRVDVIRFRFTPAKGEFYGPVGIQNQNGIAPVRPENAFLDGGAGWAGTRQAPWVEPADTFDGTEIDDGNPAGGPSLGIVDDTCSAVFTITLNLAGRPPLVARACGFVSPPDFAPDRRPFLSLADELNDRGARSLAESSAEELDDWVRDLFERVYETASLFNLDFWRTGSGRTDGRGFLGRAIKLTRSAQRSAPIAGDVAPQPDVAMGALDQLRDPNKPIGAQASSDRPLPLSERANERHRDLAELESLKALVRQQPQRLMQLVRPPFTMTTSDPNEQPRRGQRAANEGGEFTNMQMPPFMRNSNANALTLSNWQYDLLMRWSAGLLAPIAGARAVGAVGAPLSERARARQQRVLARLGLT